jgi:hypothetical protein
VHRAVLDEPVRCAGRYDEHVAGAQQPLSAVDDDAERAGDDLMALLLGRMQVLLCDDALRLEDHLEAQPLAAGLRRGLQERHAFAGGRVL